MELPVFELMISEDINDDAEVNFVSLVDRPAIQRNWNAFSDKQNFSIASEEKRIISGAIMLADTPIFRSDASHGDYYVVFSKDTIFQIVQRYFKKKYQANVNLNHNQQMQLEDVVMFESFISDKERGIMPMRGFEDAPDGSWFGSMKVDNDYAWNEVKAGNVKGFSVEGIFEYSKKPRREEAIMQQIYNILMQVELGGEGSGCRGDNCGRPKGDGVDVVSAPRVVASGDKDLNNLMSKAKEAAPELDKLGKDLAAKHGGSVTDINLKSEGSILRKVNNEEGGDLTKIKDAVRNTIVHESPDKINDIINDLRSTGKLAREPKSQRHETDPLGYSGNIVNIKLANGQIGEIQVNTPKMIYAKEKPEDAIRTLGKAKYDEIKRQTGIEGGKGHAFYEEYRVLDPMKDKSKMEEIQKKSKDYYKNFLN